MKSHRHPDVQHICEWSGKKVSSEVAGFLTMRNCLEQSELKPSMKHFRSIF